MAFSTIGRLVAFLTDQSNGNVDAGIFLLWKAHEVWPTKAIYTFVVHAFTGEVGAGLATALRIATDTAQTGVAFAPIAIAIQLAGTIEHSDFTGFGFNSNHLPHRVRDGALPWPEDERWVVSTVYRNAHGAFTDSGF